MSDRPPRYYLTTAIAYANSASPVHTLTRSAPTSSRAGTGCSATTRGSNRDRRALDRRRPDRDRQGTLAARLRRRRRSGSSRPPRTPSGSAPDRFIRTTDSDQGRPGAREARPRQRPLAQRARAGPARRGLRNATDVPGDRPRHELLPCEVPLQWLTESGTGSSGSPRTRSASRALLRRPSGLRTAGLPRATSCSASSAAGLEDFSISRERNPREWASRSERQERRERAARGRRVGPGSRQHYVWYDTLVDYVTGSGDPDDMMAFDHWWPADLDVIGKDIARFARSSGQRCCGVAVLESAPPRLGPR